MPKLRAGCPNVSYKNEEKKKKKKILRKLTKVNQLKVTSLGQLILKVPLIKKQIYNSRKLHQLLSTKLNVKIS